MRTQYFSSRKPLKVFLGVLPEFLQSTKDSCAVFQAQFSITDTEQALQFVASHGESVGLSDFRMVHGTSPGEAFLFHGFSLDGRSFGSFCAAAQVRHGLDSGEFESPAYRETAYLQK